jgi:putative pyruvate formate lyase activating enzyme
MPIPNKLKLIERALESLEGLEACCTLCPRDCRVNRRQGSDGFCRSGDRAALSSALLHFGEEPVLSGFEDFRKQKSGAGLTRAGSGTIFFTGCNLKCLFCQNYQISWFQEGRTVSDEELAGLMLGLQQQGALNINLVSPTHMILPILRGLRIAADGGLSLPVVYNSNGYDKVETLKLLEGIVDIYLPDLKYFSSRLSEELSGAPDYFEHASAALREMCRQQTELALDEGGVALRGVIIRHLVLPAHHGDSLAVLDWIKQNLPAGYGLSLMSQYHPCHQAPEDMRRPLSAVEYGDVVARAEELEFDPVFIQPEGFGPGEHFAPDFNRDDPFGWED